MRTNIQSSRIYLNLQNLTSHLQISHLFIPDCHICGQKKKKKCVSLPPLQHISIPLHIYIYISTPLIPSLFPCLWSREWKQPRYYTLRDRGGEALKHTFES